MKKTYLAVTAALVPLLGVSSAHADASHEPASYKSQRAQIEGVLSSYEKALNASDVDAVVELYTDDAVLLAANSEPAVGIDAVRQAYVGIFEAIDIDLKFAVAEVILASPDWAFLRSTGSGTITINANGAVVPGASQELFVLHKVRGVWKFARYSFSSRLPA